MNIRKDSQMKKIFSIAGITALFAVIGSMIVAHYKKNDTSTGCC